MKCLVLAGGSGDTLWPLSRKNYPKQFIYLKEGRSLFQEAIARNLPFCDEFLIVTNRKYHYIVEGQLQVFQGLKYQCILEEAKRQTAPAAAIACMCMQKDEEVLVVSTDHVIGDGDYNKTILKAREKLTDENIVVIGCRQSCRDEDVEAGHSFFVYEEDRVLEFLEKKPENKTEFLLDSGIFLTKAGTYLKALAECEPTLYEQITHGNNRMQIYNGAGVINKEWFEKLPSVSIGRGIYARWAKSGKLYIEPASFAWSRLLNTEVLTGFMEEKKKGQYLLSGCKDVSIINEDKNSLVVGNDLENLVIVNTKDATYISKKGSSSQIKKIMNQSYERWKDIFDEGDIYYTSWGMKETLTRSEGYVVKKLTIFPGKSLSTHKHEKRSEHWSIVHGIATITVANETKEYYRNESIQVPAYTYHTVANKTAEDLIIIEVSMGESAGSKVGDIVTKEEDLFLLEPAYKDYLWGGKRLMEQFGKDNQGSIIAESWELSTHKAGESVIANGKYAGRFLQEYLNECGKEVLGWKCQPFERFPLLIKFIDAKKSLSIQVHPDDEYALKEENEYGKNEMWYIMDAKEGAFLYVGFKKEMTEEELKQRIENNTLTEVMQKVPVQKGDVIFVEAKTVHAINEGVMVLEIQQSSNATYRLYDYDRMDANGCKRELHLTKAFANINYHSQEISVKPEGVMEIENGYTKQLLGECKYFSATAYEVAEKAKLSLDDSSFSSVVFIEGNGLIATQNNQVEFKAGDSFFIPAGKKVLTIEGKSKFVLSRI